MAVFTYNAVQTVNPNQVALLNTAVPCPYGFVTHQNESGTVTLKNIPGSCRTRYMCIAKANIAIPEDGTVNPISIALASEGGVLVTSRAIVTPAAALNYFNVICIGVVEAQPGCCNRVSVVNDSDTPTSGSAPAINIQNLVLVIDRMN